MAATQSPIPELICEVPVAALKAAVQAALTSISQLASSCRTHKKRGDDLGGGKLNL